MQIMESALVQTNALVKKALKLLQTALKVQSPLLNSYVTDVMHIDEFTVQPCRLTKPRSLFDGFFSIFSVVNENDYIETPTILQKVGLAK